MAIEKCVSMWLGTQMTSWQPEPAGIRDDLVLLQPLSEAPISQLERARDCTAQ